MSEQNDQVQPDDQLPDDHDPAFGDEVYQPDAPAEGDQREDTTLLDQSDTLDDRGLDQVIDEGYSPPERPLGVDHHGVTAAEQREGESLDRRLSEEVPEPDPYRSAERRGEPGAEDGPVDSGQVGDERSGRLVAPDEGVREPGDAGPEAADVGIDNAGASAEEAAVHTVDPARDDVLEPDQPDTAPGGGPR